MKNLTPRQRRMVWVGLLIAGVAVAAFLALTAFQKNLLYFYTPSQIAAGEAPKGYPFRVGGLVEQGSVQRDPQSLLVRFTVSDGKASVPIAYTGILPDLFREGQGIIAMGQLDDANVFQASEVLAKHDENYMPPEVADSLKKNGQMPTTYKDYQK
ncbi:cytochrome c maturation protein CcmE [Methylogaea oryzae]|uniref:Cytochrome c-type biogenesis protein CcmE n=1 Tax=Methylogaea oryzae TaxID=1295382 RepID=A0A8D4VJZ8_9GAMM|nr:cytochrome c maturation protein CcmE [Methylogaea oryzae]BBL69488.1 cytochrome c-type biogenesis protein CcmE [Methylogaea oryzae]